MTRIIILIKIITICPIMPNNNIIAIFTSKRIIIHKVLIPPQILL